MRLIVLIAALCVSPLLAVADEINFNRDIRPLLSDNCFHCHGPDVNHREADLRLDIEASAKESAIVPGDVESELIARINSDDEDVVMPPPDSGKELSVSQKTLLKKWIQQGAKWEKHWAYVAPRRTQPPTASEPTSNWIDNFVLDRLAAEKLAPSKPADATTLVRRLHFDLVGLPPTPETVVKFKADPSEAAYERLVDQLLESPHFGERLAIYWLDLVRYADTVGYHGDQDQNISPYRDYVIDAFNRNLPFDQFTREQLAGDLLENPTLDQKIATGYNRLLQTSHEGGVQPKEYLSIYQADRVRNVSAVWMGGTLGCAQCHDHKYDPYTAEDFYSMAAYFADIDEEQHFKKGTNSLPTARPPEIDVLDRRDRKAYEEVSAKLSKLEAEGDETLNKKIQRKKLTVQQKKLDKRRRRTMITQALEKPRTVRYLPRGNWLVDDGPVMLPSVPHFMGEVISDKRQTRLDLANWLVDSKRGSGLLTARVMANRFWYLMFGSGLSESLADFGGQGTPPTHPQLLDNLAIEFAKDWDVKQFLKLLVMSNTYRQSSVADAKLREQDPQNRLLARQSSHRLPAEMIRDAALSAGGLLVNEFGGASVKPYQPPGYYRHLNFPQRRYAHHGDQRQWRRGVYVHWQRQFLHPMLKAFDAPSREECTAERPRSNTPLAALVLLNDPTFVEAARGLAEKLITEEPTDTDRLHSAFQVVVSRLPNERETETLLELLEVSRAEYAAAPKAVDNLLDVGEASPQTQSKAELAVWTTVARAILNLSEATTRN